MGCDTIELNLVIVFFVTTLTQPQLYATEDNKIWVWHENDYTTTTTHNHPTTWNWKTEISQLLLTQTWPNF